MSNFTSLYLLAFISHIIIYYNQSHIPIVVGLYPHFWHQTPHLFQAFTEAPLHRNLLWFAAAARPAAWVAAWAAAWAAAWVAAWVAEWAAARQGLRPRRSRSCSLDGCHPTRSRENWKRWSFRMAQCCLALDVLFDVLIYIYILYHI